ncbi:MAG: hypothetical protein AAGF95_18800 [Chloroflexota bacterium]
MSIPRGCSQTQIPKASVLGTDLFLTQTSSSIDYELHVSEPAKVTLTLDTLARSIEATLFECSTIPLATSEEICIISGTFDRRISSEHATLNFHVNPSAELGTHQTKAIHLRVDELGRINVGS